jgi:short subunit dehydrogenase-like uncharacterized protein
VSSSSSGWSSRRELGLPAEVVDAAPGGSNVPFEMMQVNSRFVVYGASGRTGSRVCSALVASGARVIAVGRSQAKLEAALRDLGGNTERIAANIDDQPRLREALAKGRVVINCAGPFMRCGRAIQDAALAVGRHCLDMSGEPDFVRATLARHLEARQRGVLLVSGVGFDVVPTDALAAQLAEALGGEVEAARVAYSRLDAAPTRGLGRTMLQGLLDGGVAFVEGSWKNESIGHDRWTVRFPAPTGVRSCVSLPWGDVASLPLSTGARTVRAYLPRTFPPPELGTALLRALRWALPARAFERVGEWLARPMLQRLPLSASRNFPVSAVVELTGRSGTKTGWVTAREGIAIQAAALCARICAAPGFDISGALTPARAFGAGRLLAELGRHGLEWGTD